MVGVTHMAGTIGQQSCSALSNALCLLTGPQFMPAQFFRPLLQVPVWIANLTKCCLVQMLSIV